MSIRRWNAGCRGILIAVCTAVAVSAAGCAHSGGRLGRPAPEALPEYSPLRNRSLAVGDAWMRHHLLAGFPDSAIALFDDGGPTPVSDKLLSALQRAVLFRESGDHQRSIALLEWAELEAERRQAVSVSRTAGSLLINDGVLDYTSGAIERRLMSFYRMLNYLDLGSNEGAAVEARRIGSLDPTGRCDLDGTLYYLSALVFEGVGDVDDGLIAIRNADRVWERCDALDQRPPGFIQDFFRLAAEAGHQAVLDTLSARFPDVRRESGAEAEIVVLVENGFVAHRVSSSIHVPIFDDDLLGLSRDDEPAIFERAGYVAARLAANFAEREVWGSAWDDDPGVQFGQALSGAHILKLAWPALSRADRRDRRSFADPMVRVDGRAVALEPVLDMNGLNEQMLGDERAGMITRLIARGVAKYLISSEIENRAEEDGAEVLGFIASRLANAAFNRLEEADTRSWNLLPEGVMFSRALVAPGSVTVEVELQGTDGSREAVVLGPFELAEGERRIVPVRIFPNGRPDRQALSTE